MDLKFLCCFAEWSRNRQVLEEVARMLSFGLGYPCIDLLERYLFHCCLSHSCIISLFDPVMGTHYIYLHYFLQTLNLLLMLLSLLIILLVVGLLFPLFCFCITPWDCLKGGWTPRHSNGFLSYLLIWTSDMHIINHKFNNINHSYI